MSTERDPFDLSYLAPAGGIWGHRAGRDPRSPEEIAAAQAKENARRKGRGRKDWWKAHLDEHGRPKD